MDQGAFLTSGKQQGVRNVLLVSPDLLATYLVSLGMALPFRYLISFLLC